MEKLLLVAALACQPGDQLVDLSSKIPARVQSPAYDGLGLVRPRSFTLHYIVSLHCSSSPDVTVRAGQLNHRH
jgi:hypothetical protein